VPMAKKTGFDDTGYNYLLIALIIVALIIGGYFVLNKQVPYTIEEVYTVEEPYYETVFYNETEFEEVSVPYTGVKIVEETTESESTVQGSRIESRDYRGVKECHFLDFEYTIEYLGMPQSEDDYDYYSRLGYKKGKYIIGVNICNKEPTTLNAEFDICRLSGETLSDCSDSADWNVPANRCRIFNLFWHTSFDFEKRIELRPRIVSKKATCRATNSDGEFSEIHFRPENVIYDDGISNKDEMLSEAGLVLKTDSGYLRVPKSRSNILSSKDTSYTTKYTKKVPYTEYKTETKEVVVTKSRQEEKFRTVEKKREVTKYRSLWDELKIRIVG